MHSAVTQLGTIMGVWAHPDDETFTVGGIMALAAAQGQKVVCVTATKGEAGVQDPAKWPAASLGQIREQEVTAALNILGVPQPHWLDYRDGQCADIPDEEAIQRVVAFIDEHRPDTVVTFPPDGVTGHPDHQAVSRWTTAAVKQSRHKPALYFAVQTQESYDSFWQVVDEKFNFYFATDKPVFVPQQSCDIVALLEPEIAALKTAALKAMPSQYEAMFEFLGDKGVQAAIGVEALIRSNSQ